MRKGERRKEEPFNKFVGKIDGYDSDMYLLYKMHPDGESFFPEINLFHFRFD